METADERRLRLLRETIRAQQKVRAEVMPITPIGRWWHRLGVQFSMALGRIIRGKPDKNAVS